jgi:hypothetical protein
MEWISVKDRLPEKNQKVLFIAKAENRLAYLNGEVLSGKFDGLEFETAIFTIPGIAIEGTYWRPRPDPPKEAQDERG